MCQSYNVFFILDQNIAIGWCQVYTGQAGIVFAQLEGWFFDIRVNSTSRNSKIMSLFLWPLVAAIMSVLYGNERPLVIQPQLPVTIQCLDYTFMVQDKGQSQDLCWDKLPCVIFYQLSLYGGSLILGICDWVIYPYSGE